MDKEKHIRNFRSVLAVLAIIPTILLVVNLIYQLAGYSEDSILETVFLICGLPILVLNLWAWEYPKIIKFLLWGDKEDSKQ